MQKIKKILKIVGPGVITGAAGDDPSGIATYTQAGAKFGYNQLWTTIFILPLVTAVQEACARIGAVTGKGLTMVIKKYYSKKVLFLVVFLILIANTINIGANIGAMAAAARLIIPLNFSILALFFTALILILEIFLSYRVYAKVLKWCVLSLLAYPITIFLIKHPWLELLKATFIPHLEFSFGFLFIIVAVLGTTISPYMFFWQASEEVEEEKSHHLFNYGKPKISKKFMHNLRLDNFLGMLFSQIAAWCIIVAAGTVLHNNGILDVKSAADAARALEPLVNTFPNAGLWAKVIFAFGIVGLGLLSVPVLSASASYAVSEVFSWKEGLNLKFKKAHGFYGVITAATIIGLMINYIGIDPIKALIFTAVINGVVSVPLLFLINRIASDQKIMGEYKSGWLSRVFLWLVFFIMLLSSLAMFATIRQG
ncbi:divalent metal cation transporter [Patescibacteria group bacterium]|nr:divalent metal cation transporter [Patescibacteria group bacterium]MBU1663505.1 divalent metal cation transporter [Patescibacteria group bacterium]MBU1934000.1 divalent metal cation transporter [Patescibacteria group bacterium]MBU2008178.1 divalent metal cation transporter [Patescibacteria group bacterium]MBU2233908.1 divalent metal cation transporter [Patescibacteria group bacterium]